MTFLSRFKPSRSQVTGKDFELIADIDAVVSTPIGFKLFGRNHVVKPLDLEAFFQWTEKLAAMWALNKKETATPIELEKAYFDLIHSVCPSITLKDIQKCQPAQIAAISGLLFDHCTGKAHTDEYQKKKRRMMEATGNKATHSTKSEGLR